MKRLYTIILILLFTACGGTQSSELIEQTTPTIPREWLTRPPTPGITRGATSQQEAAAIEPPATASPEPVPTEQEVATEQEVEPTETPIFKLPKLFGRLWTISANPGVPQELINAARAMAADRPDDFLWVEPGSLPTDLTLTPGGQEPLAEWLYVVAAPFATVEDDITETELKQLWSSKTLVERQLLLSRKCCRIPAGVVGRAGGQCGGVEASEDLKEALWRQRPSLTILPFHELTPDLKLLRLDGQSPFDPEFKSEAYPLQMAVGLEGEQEALTAFLGAWQDQASNYDPDKITTVGHDRCDRPGAGHGHADGD